MKQVVVVVGKAPQPGTTKTRLCPPLTPEQAAALYAAFLQDTVRTAISLGWQRVAVIHPPGPAAEHELRLLLPDTVCLQTQSSHGLGSALSEAFRTQLEAGFERVVLIGSDNPTLPRAILEAASDALAEHDLALGPSADGGYYLVAMADLHTGIFERITWSTEVVYQETLRRARELALSVAHMPEWYDVDTASDLQRLRRELGQSDGGIASATRAVLDDLSLS